jgi:hypothetical protein
MNLPLAEMTKPLGDHLWGDAMRMRELCLADARFILTEQGLAADQVNVSLLAKGIGTLIQRASLVLKRHAEGHFPEAFEPRHGGTSPAAYSSGLGSRLSTTSLLEGWWKEAQAAGRKPSTYESYRNTIQQFVRFRGHENAASVTTSDVLRFKDHRVQTPVIRTGRVPSAKTVKDSDLSALKAVFGWGVANRMLASNPAAGITIKLGKAPKLRSKGFTEAEASAILSAALSYESEREHLRTIAAKRWVPWLCAFTGARVGEMAQLRKQDVFCSGEHWIIRITPEAGTVKTNEARQVVLHPQLLGG